jgi:light-harvesting complex I chlorophyll a/b binding protein 1
MSASKVPLLGWAQIIFFIGLVENTGFFQKIGGIGFQKDVTMAGTPGDYGVGFPNFIGKVADPVEKKTKLNAELANGRLAMVAIIGMFFQDGLTGMAGSACAHSGGVLSSLFVEESMHSKYATC